MEAAQTSLGNIVDPGFDLKLINAQRAHETTEIADKIQRALESLPFGTFYRGKRDFLISLEDLEKCTRFIGDRGYVIELDNQDDKIVGLWLPKGSVPITLYDTKTVFQYKSRTFEVRHDLPFYRDLTDIF